ncbi:MAG: hypothetical protein D6722_07975 [Bacteroidetes bacterium]|nr:MAG: hypothetical protein D6722_07975 [Bacteroidota bacterium]
MSQNIYRFFFLFLCVVGIFPLQAQYSWQNLGPDNRGGITRALAFDANGHILAGAQGGGLWRSTDGGESWQRVTTYDQAGGNPNITSIAVSGQTIYVGTGATRFRRPYVITEFNYNPDLYDYRETAEFMKGNLGGLPGGGVFVSTDNGATWSNNNATYSEATTGIYQGPFTDIMKVYTKDSRVFVATPNGLFYSDDNLQNITKSSGSDFFEENLIWDVEAAAGQVILAAAHKEGRNTFDSLYISWNGGSSFQVVVNDVLYGAGTQPLGFAGTEIAVAPSDPNIVYVASTQASLEVSGVFRYDIAADTWERVAPRGNPGFTPLANNGRDAFVLEVFPDNSNELILAGNSWYTYLEGRGWTQTAQHTNPTRADYLPRSQYVVAFDPSNSSRLFVGTSNAIMRSDDGGESFFQRTKGYEACVTYSVSAFGLEIEGDEPAVYESVLAGTQINGIIYNRHFLEDKPSSQAFGVISNTNFSEVSASALYPGAIVAQGNDGGLVRSLNFGDNFEAFYGFPISPQVTNLIIPNSVDTIIDRPNDTQAGGNLNNNPVPAQSTWVLDEYVPNSVLTNPNLTTEEVQAASGSYVFFCSKNYVWAVNGAFGDGLQVKWNRITNALVDGVTEHLTAITASGDDQHTLYVGSSKGNIWRIDRAHDLENFDVDENITKLNIDFVSFITFTMTDRSVTSMAVDPQNPNRLVVTFAGYGPNVQSVPGFVWATDSALSDAPGFGTVNSPNGEGNQPFYSAAFAIEDGNSVLLLGGEKGLYSVRGLEVTSYSSGQLPQPYNWPNYNLPAWTDEFGQEFGNVPVYDIFVRRYKSRVKESALIRDEIRSTYLPDEDTTVFDTIQVERDNLQLAADQTIFVATYGRGIWSTTSIAPQRQGQLPEDALLPEALSVRFFPNPAQAGSQGTLRLDLTEKADVRVEVLGLDGRRHQQQQASLLAGPNRDLSLDLGGLAAGLYLIRVEVQGETQRSSHTLKAVISE